MCGCNNAPIWPSIGETDAPGRSPAHAMACGAMCVLCVGGRRGACPATGRDALAMAVEGSCPLGRHPDGRGIVRWQGTEWMGVPAVIRWAWPVLRRLHGLPALSGPLPGCGCHAASKEAWLAFQRERPATARRIQAVGQTIIGRLTRSVRPFAYTKYASHMAEEVVPVLTAAQYRPGSGSGAAAVATAGGFGGLRPIPATAAATDAPSTPKNERRVESMP
jgi:hypothetical protein